MIAAAKTTMSGMYTKGNEYNIDKKTVSYTSDTYAPWGWEERTITVEQYELKDDSGNVLNIDEKILRADFII